MRSCHWRRKTHLGGTDSFAEAATEPGKRCYNFHKRYEFAGVQMAHMPSGQVQRPLAVAAGSHSDWQIDCKAGEVHLDQH